jgi:peptidoglycan/LPS O-acetylase OafA/YrhL
MKTRAGKSSFPHLDGIRGLAALAILGYHGVGGNYRSVSGWVQMGTALRSALPFFFFLSAFLLYRPYVVARVGDGPRPPLRSFWWRRFLRIVPAYWVALTVITLTVGLPGVFGPEGWRYYTFIYVYDHQTVMGGLVPAWTLCVDLTFYLALPFFALAMDRLWRRFTFRTAVNLELVVLGLIWLLSTLYWFRFVSGASVGVDSLAIREWNLVANLNWFALGMGLAVLSATDGRRRSALTRVLSKAHAVDVAWIGALLTFLIISRTYFFSSETTRHLLASLFCILIFAPTALVPRQGGAQRILAHPAVTWLGVASYGIYLYHGPVLNELRSLGVRIGTHGPVTYLSLLAATLPIVIGLSAASYFLLERPIMRWGRRVEGSPAARDGGGRGVATSADAVAVPAAPTEVALKAG